MDIFVNEPDLPAIRSHRPTIRLTLLLLYSTTTLSGCWTLNEPNRAGGFFHKNSADFLYFSQIYQSYDDDFRYGINYNIIALCLLLYIRCVYSFLDTETLTFLVTEALLQYRLSRCRCHEVI